MYREFDLPDIFNCSVCFGAGYLIMEKYTHSQLVAIINKAETYLLAGRTNHLCCPRCKGNGKIKDLEIEPIKDLK